MVDKYNASDIDKFIELMYKDVIVSRCNNLVKESNSMIIDDEDTNIYVTVISFECNNDIMNEIIDNITEGINKMFSREFNGLVSYTEIKSGEINYNNELNEEEDVDYIKTELGNYREIKITIKPMNNSYKIVNDS